MHQFVFSRYLLLGALYVFVLEQELEPQGTLRLVDVWKNELLNLVCSQTTMVCQGCTYFYIPWGNVQPWPLIRWCPFEDRKPFPFRCLNPVLRRGSLRHRFLLG